MNNRFENWSLRTAFSLQDRLHGCWTFTPRQMPMLGLRWKTRTDCQSSKPWLAGCRLSPARGQVRARSSAMPRTDLCCKIRKTKKKLRLYYGDSWKILPYGPKLGNELHEQQEIIRGTAMPRILGNFC